VIDRHSSHPHGFDAVDREAAAAAFSFLARPLGA
jgi:hypothetical protein